jgi:ribonuclease HI
MTNADPAAIEAIVAAIQALPPQQRRQLQRRLRLSGLFVPETAITDQQRLLVAPAMGLQQQPQSAPVNAIRSQGMGEAPAVLDTPLREPTAPALVAPLSASAPPYRSVAGGRVVVYTPGQESRNDDPHAMQPLPGQAPEQPIGVIFDGGSKGNPGLGYGSYALRWPGAQQQIVKLRFGNHVTNNEAEYDTLIGALEAIIKRLQDNGAGPATAKLDIRGDSLLVINQVLGKWQCKEESMQVRRDKVRQLLQQFGVWQLTHHDRAKSVEVLGH